MLTFNFFLINTGPVSIPSSIKWQVEIIGLFSNNCHSGALHPLKKGRSPGWKFKIPKLKLLIILSFKILSLLVSELIKLGFNIIATDGTAEFFNKNGINAIKINKVLEGSPHIVEEIKNNKVSLVFNTTETPQAIKDSKSIRRSALEAEVPYYTTVSGAIASVLGIKSIINKEISVRTIQSYGKLLN